MKVIDNGHSVVWRESFKGDDIPKTVSPQAVAGSQDGLVKLSLHKFPLKQDECGKVGRSELFLQRTIHAPYSH